MGEIYLLIISFRVSGCVFRRLEREPFKSGIDEWPHRAGRSAVQYLGALNQTEMLIQFSRERFSRIADDIQPAAAGRSGWGERGDDESDRRV